MTAVHRMMILAFVAVSAAGIAKDEAKMLKIGGIDVILRRTSANEVVNAILFIKGGASALPSNMSPALEGMTLAVVGESGSTKYSKDEYQRKLSNMVSTIGGGGGRDYSTFSMRCVREHFNDTWKLFCDAVTSPAFDSIEVMKDKRNSITAIKSVKSQPEQYAQFLADSVFYLSHPYARRPTVDEVAAIKIDDLKKHFAEQMVKSRLLLVVVGNVSEDDVRKGIESSLASLPEGSYTQPVLPALTRHVGTAIYDKKTPTTYIFGYCAVPNRRQPDYWAIAMASSTLNDRLFSEVRTKRNLSYAPQAGVRGDETAMALVGVSTTMPDSCMHVIFNCIDSISNVPMSEKELKSQKAQLLTVVYLREETNASSAEALGRYQLMTGSWENSLHVVDNVQKLTPADVQAAAKKYYHGFNFGAVGKAEKIDRALLESR